jgi:predicted  nucleic acid-binding Zn-ribbon protein
MEDAGIDNSELLKRLVRLQEVNLEIGRLHAQVDGVPQRLAELEAQLESDRHGVDSARESIDDTVKSRRSLEREVEDLRTKLSKYRDQLMQVKTNTEYQAMLHEIGFVESQVREKEDLILECMVEADELENGLAAARKDFARKQEQMELQKKEVEAFVDHARGQLAELEEELKVIESELPRDFLDRYQRIALARGGVAVAPVTNQSCDACHVRIRPQVLAEIRTGRDIIVCENCSRILYYSASA